MNKKMWFIALAFLLTLWSCKKDLTASGEEEKPNLGPGIIEWVSVPDSMKIPPAGMYQRALVTAAVSDPDGLQDVDSVYFYSRKPDGTLANSGKPFVLKDNGKPFNIQNPFEEVGDSVAGDGIYSLSVILTTEAQTGTYVFTFYMRDRAGNLSAPKRDTIEVYQ